MDRIQLYPPEELKFYLSKDARNRKCSVSQVAVDILMEHYGLLTDSESKVPIGELHKKIFKEVTKFINESAIGTEFDLLTASETFRQIHMVADGKPALNRANVGRAFSLYVKTGLDPYRKVEPVYTDSGKPKKSINRAQVYRIAR